MHDLEDHENTKGAGERLQKLIALAGVSSRRTAEEMIGAGRVTVNGKVVRELGSRAVLGRDLIAVDGTMLQFSSEAPIILMMHKPPKVIVTVSDPQGRQNVYSLLNQPPWERFGPKKMPRVFAVGRLDYDAEGLLLFTNDGNLADVLTHPRKNVPKTYLVKVSGVVEDKGLRRIQQGVHLKEADGRVKKTLPAFVELHRKTDKHAWYSVTVTEGRNRLLKRLFSAVGHPVRRILRIEFAGLKLGELPEGQWRALSPEEEKKLRSWLQKTAAEHTPIQRPIRTNSGEKKKRQHRPPQPGSRDARENAPPTSSAKTKTQPWTPKSYASSKTKPRNSSAGVVSTKPSKSMRRS